jgi:RimJ/RimL family protein N-acetyltransferase
VVKRVTFDSLLVGPWVCERLGGDFNAGDNAIGLQRDDGTIVAGVTYDNYLRNSICAHIAIEGAITREFLRAIFAYPFEQLKVHKIIGPVDSVNAAARRFDEHLGFVAEAVIEGAGRFGNLILFTMTRSQCRWL